MAGRHAAEVRRAAVELFSKGHGETFVANRLGLSRAVVEDRNRAHSCPWLPSRNQGFIFVTDRA